MYSLPAYKWDTTGNGIINADGDAWRLQRKIGLRFFSVANLKTFINEVLPPTLADAQRRLDDASEMSSIIDLQHVLLELTTRLIGKVAYDVCFLMKLMLKWIHFSF